MRKSARFTDRGNDAPQHERLVERHSFCHLFGMDIIRIIFSILLPPLGVFLQVGIGAQFWINILLTILGYFPGVIHAIYIIVTRD
jgi:uncharacterized membrane protein YqaE (UPF0057 family)